MPLMPECEKWKQCIWNNVSIWRIEDCESCVAACYFWQQWVTHETFPTSQSTPHPLIRSYSSTKTEADPTQRARKNNFSTACKFGEKQKKPTSELRCQSHVYMCMCMCVCVTVYEDMCVSVCACLCMSVCCCTLGSCCRFEVGSPGAHSDNCTSIIFCSSILCWFFYSFHSSSLLEYLSHCRVLFFPVLSLCSRVEQTKKYD